MPAGTCTFPGCGRPHRARGYCVGHLAQLARDQELAPLRLRGRTGVQLVPLPIRVTPEAAERASQDPDGAREALDRWAARRR